MDKFQVSVLEYLGKLESGVLVLVSIIYNNNYYEATYFYTTDQLVLTITEELEYILGHKIIDDDEYSTIIKSIIKKVVPFDEIYNRIDDVDFSRWMVDEIEEKE